MQKFSLAKARKGAPLCFEDGTPVKLVAYVPEARKAFRLIVLVGDEVRIFDDAGYNRLGLYGPHRIYMAPTA